MAALCRGRHRWKRTNCLNVLTRNLTGKQYIVIGILLYGYGEHNGTRLILGSVFLSAHRKRTNQQRCFKLTLVDLLVIYILFITVCNIHGVYCRPGKLHSNGVNYICERIMLTSYASRPVLRTNNCFHTRRNRLVTMI